MNSELKIVFESEIYLVVNQVYRVNGFAHKNVVFLDDHGKKLAYSIEMPVNYFRELPKDIRGEINEKKFIACVPISKYPEVKDYYENDCMALSTYEMLDKSSQRNCALVSNMLKGNCSIIEERKLDQEFDKMSEFYIILKNQSKQLPLSFNEFSSLYSSYLNRIDALPELDENLVHAPEHIMEALIIDKEIKSLFNKMIGFIEQAEKYSSISEDDNIVSEIVDLSHTIGNILQGFKYDRYYLFMDDCTDKYNLKILPRIGNLFENLDANSNLVEVENQLEELFEKIQSKIEMYQNGSEHSNPMIVHYPRIINDTNFEIQKILEKYTDKTDWDFMYTYRERYNYEILPKLSEIL
jgi:hypothetical protein